MTVLNEKFERPIQNLAEKLFVEYFHRLHNKVVDHKVSYVDAIRIARELTYDTALLNALEDSLQHDNLEMMGIFDMRTKHFKRLVLNQFFNDSINSKALFDDRRACLLHFIDVIEIAVGRYRFEESHLVCDQLIIDLKASEQFSFQSFFKHPTAMMEYCSLMLSLAVFLENNPKHRITWLIHSMESIPSTHMEQGIAVYNQTKSFQTPTEKQISDLLISIYTGLLGYLKDNQLFETVHSRLPQLATPPESLLNQLIQDMSAIH